MEFDIKKREHPNLRNYKLDDLKLARQFAKRIYDEYGSYLMGVILFGSTARGSQGDYSDIDLLLVIDDISVELSEQLIQSLRIVTEKVIVETSKKLHVVTMKFTAFWEYMRNGDPVAINILRDGFPLVDTGFFLPMQQLLRQGRIRPTMESVYTYFDRAPRTLLNSNWHILQAVLDLYWAVIDSAHAALMRLGEVPPSPEHVGELIREKMVKPKLVEPKYAEIMEDFYKVQKMITSRQLKMMKGSAYDKYRKNAEDFVIRMKNFIG